MHTLANRERVQVLIPPACEQNTVSITIRKPSLIDKTLEELNAEGAFEESEEHRDGLQPFEHQLLSLKQEKRYMEFLDLAVRTHRNILIVGKTGSGKTTITKSLTRSIPATERLITIEDVHEIFLNQHPNKVHLFYAREDEAGSKVSPKQALASCLRMKPDRILLAELRGDEAWEFIKSINTGHPGSISTMHANGAYEAFEHWYHFRSNDTVERWLYISGGIALAFVLSPLLVFLLPNKQSLFGDARFAKKREINQAGLFGERGLIVGKYAGKIPDVRRTAARHHVRAHTQRQGRWCGHPQSAQLAG